MRAGQGYNTYSQNNVSVESSEKLIMMLYDGILRFASRAKVSMEAKDIEKKTYWINRTSDIFIELINSLEYSAGNVAYYLEGIYNRQIELLTQANLKNETAPLDEVLNVTKELSAAWRENVLEVQNESVE